MYGAGTYFADQARKSLGYTSLQGSYWAQGCSNEAFMGLYQVHLGNMLEKQKHEGWMYNLNEKRLKELGQYDSFFAKGGIDLCNNEYIIYNEDKSSIKYLVELR